MRTEVLITLRILSCSLVSPNFVQFTLLFLSLLCYDSSCQGQGNVRCGKGKYLTLIKCMTFSSMSTYLMNDVLNKDLIESVNFNE